MDTTSKNKEKKSRKKYLKIFGFTIIGLILILFILFSIFVANPFEKDYPKNLLTLLPNKVETVFYLPNPQDLLEKGKRLFSLEKLRYHPQWKKFTTTSLYKNLKRDIHLKRILKQNDQLKQRLGINILQLKNLWEVAGREIVCASYIDIGTNRLHYIMATRVSFKIKLLYGLIKFLPSSIKKKNKLKYKSGMLSTRNIHAMKYKDLILVSNQQSFLKLAKSILKGQKRNILKTSTLLKNKYSTNKSEPILYCKLNKYIRKYIYRIRSKTLNRVLPGLESFAGSLKISKTRADMDFNISLKPNYNELFGQYFKGNQKKFNIPRLACGYATLSMPWLETWTKLKKHMPMKLKRTIFPYLQMLNRIYNTNDLVEELILQYFQGRVALVTSNIDFVKEDISPLDIYPANSIMIRSNNPEKLLKTLEFAFKQLNREFVEKNIKGEVFYYKEQYADKDFLRIRFPDVSGGSIRPAIGAVGNYFIITSHIAFLKDMAGIEEKAAQGLQELISYKQLRPVLNYPVTSFMDGTNTLQALKNLKPFIVTQLALHNKSLYSNFNRLKKQISKQFEEIVDAVEIYKLGVGIGAELKNENIEGTFSLFVKLK